jgi:hypothetical protein
MNGAHRLNLAFRLRKWKARTCHRRLERLRNRRQTRREAQRGRSRVPSALAESGDPGSDAAYRVHRVLMRAGAVASPEGALQCGVASTAGIDLGRRKCGSNVRLKDFSALHGW